MKFYRTNASFKKMKIYALAGIVAVSGIVGVGQKLKNKQEKEERQVKIEQFMEDYDKVYSHVSIQAGDTLYDFAKEEFAKNPEIYYTVYKDINDYIDEIQETNSLGNKNHITSGGVILMPIYQPKQTVVEQAMNDMINAPVEMDYIVQAGDELGYIASTFGTTVDSICRLNHIDKKDFLQCGQTLKIQTTAYKKMQYQDSIEPLDMDVEEQNKIR